VKRHQSGRYRGTEACIVSSFALVTEATARIPDFSSSMHHLLYRDSDGLPARLAFAEGIQGTRSGRSAGAYRASKSRIPRAHGATDGWARGPRLQRWQTGASIWALKEQSVDFMTTIGNVVPITLITQLIGFRHAEPRIHATRPRSTPRRWSADVSLSTSLKSSWRGVLKQTPGSPSSSTPMVPTPTAKILGTIMLAAIRDGALSEEDGVIILQNLLGAGGESTTSLLGNSVRILAERPELQQELRRAPDLIPIFIEEALRLESPFRFLMRYTPHDTTLGGVDIPAGRHRLAVLGRRQSRCGSSLTSPTRCGSTVPRRVTIWRLGVGSTTVSVHRSPAGGTGGADDAPCPALAGFGSTTTGCHGGSTASRCVATSNLPIQMCR